MINATEIVVSPVDDKDNALKVRNAAEQNSPTVNINENNLTLANTTEKVVSLVQYMQDELNMVNATEIVVPPLDNRDADLTMRKATEKIALLVDKKEDDLTVLTTNETFESQVNTKQNELPVVNATEIVVSPVSSKEDEPIESSDNESLSESELLELPNEVSALPENTKIDGVDASEVSTLPESTEVDGVDGELSEAKTQSEVSLQNAIITEITVSPVDNEDDVTEFKMIIEDKDECEFSLLEATESEITILSIRDEDSETEFKGSTVEEKQNLQVRKAVVEDKDETESLNIIHTSFTEKDEHVTANADIIPFNIEETPPITLGPFEDNTSLKLPGSANGPRWGTILPQGVFCKDFLPKKCPDKSSCWSTIYTSFGEVVEAANAWLSMQTKIRVVGCEAVPMNASGSSAQRDAWPHHTTLRGVRIWVQKSPQESPRVVLGYRDFIPRQKTKGMFSGTAQTVEELCAGISSYLTNRLPSVSLVSVQTLDVEERSRLEEPVYGDAPVSGVYDTDIDTESGAVSYAPNGFSRFCRFLRIFFLTEYQTSKTKKIAPTAVVVGIKDFSARSNEDTVAQVIERALAWCDAESAVHLRNLEVLNQKAGHASSSYTWLLESPGMVHCKFYRFVRLVYILDDLVDERESMERKWEESNAITQEPWRDRSFSEDFDCGVWNTELKGFSCTSFLPQVVEPHCSVWGGVWETTEELTNRVSAWLLESKRQLVTISTHHVRTVGNSVSLDDTAWVRHAPFAVWLPVIHVITTS